MRTYFELNALTINSINDNDERKYTVNGGRGDHIRNHFAVFNNFYKIGISM